MKAKQYGEVNFKLNSHARDTFNSTKNVIGTDVPEFPEVSASPCRRSHAIPSSTFTSTSRGGRATTLISQECTGTSCPSPSGRKTLPKRPHVALKTRIRRTLLGG